MGRRLGLASVAGTLSRGEHQQLYDVHAADHQIARARSSLPREGHAAVVQLLIERGASVSAATLSGDTPLTLAQENQNDDVIRILTAAGAT